MLLERLVMSNFKRFREADIRFRDGITRIVGNNGTGKSIIVEAILFALYGRTRRRSSACWRPWRASPPAPAKGPAPVTVKLVRAGS